MIKLGKNAKLYYNTGTYATPTWVEIKYVTDVRVTLTATETEISTRATVPFKTYVSGLIDLGFECDYSWIEGDDSVFTAIKNAFLDGTPMDIAIMDGNIAVSGTHEGIRSPFVITRLDLEQTLDGAQKFSLAGKATLGEHPPEWYTITTP